MNPKIILDVAQDLLGNYCWTVVKPDGSSVSQACSSLEQGLRMAMKELGLPEKEYKLIF